MSLSAALRHRWLRGRYANVDGIPYAMPIDTKGSPALTSVYTIDADKAAAMLPGQELHPLRFGSRGLLVVAVIDYQDTTIGKYVEYCIGIACTRGRKPMRQPLPLLFPGRCGTGVYIYDLPVSSEISVKGGLGIWGMAKRHANLDFVVDKDRVSSQYDLDGQTVLRVDVPRSKWPALPFVFSGVGWGDFRGLLFKSYINVRGRAGLVLGRRRKDARLLIGDHERAAPLRDLDVSERPLMCCYVASAKGVLDDHIETWYLTSDEPPGTYRTELRDVIDLGLSQRWLEPPNRAASDRDLAAGHRLVPSNESLSGSSESRG